MDTRITGPGNDVENSGERRTPVDNPRHGLSAEGRASLPDSPSVEEVARQLATECRGSEKRVQKLVEAMDRQAHIPKIVLAITMLNTLGLLGVVIYLAICQHFGTCR